MDKTSNTLETFLTEQQLKEYLSKEYPFNTNFLGQILKEKLKQDPDYEVWVPLFYCKYMLRRKDKNSPSVVHSPFVFISNKGKISRLKEDVFITLPVILTGSYPWVTVTVGHKDTYPLLLHRGLASVFIPVPEELKLYHPKNLEVNHIDGVKSNFELENLEWTTKSGNQEHALLTGLIKSGKDSVHTKPVKGKVEFGPHAGYEFILHGLADYKRYRFTQSNIVTCCKGRVRSHKNCSWSYATELELIQLPNGLSEEIRESLDGIRRCVMT